MENHDIQILVVRLRDAMDNIHFSEREIIDVYIYVGVNKMFIQLYLNKKNSNAALIVFWAFS